MTGPPKTVMLFAAGFGTRMGALTQHRPKPLIKVGGTALIDHALSLARQINPSVIVANTHYKADQMESHLRPLDVVLSPEQPDILETGGGLKAALPLLGPDPVFTMNTDALWRGPNPLQLLIKAWNPLRMDALLMCIPAQATLGHEGSGDFALSTTGCVQRGSGFVYGGVQIIRTEGLSDIHDQVFSLNLLWDQMLERDRLFALSYPGNWCDVGHPEGLNIAEKLLRRADD